MLDTTLSAMESEELTSFILKESCKNNHDSLSLMKIVLWASTNTMLNNLCFKKNDQLIQEKKKQEKESSKL